MEVKCIKDRIIIVMDSPVADPQALAEAVTGFVVAYRQVDMFDDHSPMPVNPEIKSVPARVKRMDPAAVAMDGIDQVWKMEIGVPPYARIAKAIKPLLDAGEPPMDIVQHFADFVAHTDPKFVSAENFALRYSSIRNGRYGKGDQVKSEWATVLDDLLLDDEVKH